MGVGVGDCKQGDAGVVNTHGWVLPGKEEFAVCWNGLVYPIVSAGAAANLHADIASLLQTDQQARKERATASNPGDAPDRELLSTSPYGAVTETFAVSARSMLPFKAVLLLRLGEGELATTLWSQWFTVVKNTVPGTLPEVFMPSTDKLAAEESNASVEASQDPYLWFAKSWAWAQFDRALNAHMRGDDHLALVCARALVPVQAAVESEAGRRRFAPADLERRTYLEFLGLLPDLIADSARRVAEVSYTPVLDLAEPPTGTERISSLIRDLELASAGQGIRRGTLVVGASPIVQALAHEGEPAIEPLLQCLEQDQRLTRSVRYGQNLSTERAFIGVQEAAA